MVIDLEDVIKMILEVGVWKAYLGVVIIIMLDALLGAICAVKEGEFDLRKLPQFLATNVFPYCGGLLLLSLAASLLPSLFTVAIFTPVTGFVALKYILEMKDKIRILFGGDPWATKNNS